MTNLTRRHYSSTVYLRTAWPYLSANPTSPASIFIDDERVAISDLGNHTLNHVFADNPQMVVRDIYTDAQIVVCGESQVRGEDTAAVVERLRMEGFQKLRVATAGQSCHRRGQRR